MKIRPVVQYSVVALALAAMSLLAPAQQTAPENLQQAAADLDCGQLASMPNPPMSMEACEAQKAAFANLGAAASAPGGERPGDAAMECRQIIAELQSSNFSGVSATTAAEGKAAGEELRAATASAHARAAALAGRQTAETAAASLGPNAVGGAVATRQAAEQAALSRSAAAEVGAARNRTTMANAASARELAASLQANPRVARLIQLAAVKNCKMP